MSCNRKRTTPCSGVEVSCSRTGSVNIPCSRVLVLILNYSDFPHYTFRLPYFFTLISSSVFLSMLFITIVIFIFPFSILSLFFKFHVRVVPAFLFSFIALFTVSLLLKADFREPHIQTLFFSSFFLLNRDYDAFTDSVRLPCY